MSAFLGPIHHWLYNKVLWHESLLDEIYTKIEVEGFNPATLKEAAESQFGAPVTAPLESVINTGNIHGWLQEKIESLELRMAFVIHQALTTQVLNLDQLKSLYHDNALKASAQNNIMIDTPEQAFKAMGDFLLDGMPCDRVHAPIANETDTFVWSKRMCVHTPYWDRVGADIAVFNTLRESWLTSFVGEHLMFESKDDTTFAFKKRSS